MSIEIVIPLYTKEHFIYNLLRLDDDRFQKRCYDTVIAEVKQKICLDHITIKDYTLKSIYRDLGKHQIDLIKLLGEKHIFDLLIRNLPSEYTLIETNGYRQRARLVLDVLYKYDPRRIDKELYDEYDHHKTLIELFNFYPNHEYVDNILRIYSPLFISWYKNILYHDNAPKYFVSMIESLLPFDHDYRFNIAGAKEFALIKGLSSKRHIKIVDIFNYNVLYFIRDRLTNVVYNKFTSFLKEFVRFDSGFVDFYDLCKWDTINISKLLKHNLQSDYANAISNLVYNNVYTIKLDIPASKLFFNDIDLAISKQKGSVKKLEEEWLASWSDVKNGAAPVLNALMDIKNDNSNKTIIAEDVW